MLTQTTLPSTYPQMEGASGRYTATVTDETGATLPGSLLLTLTLTLYALDTARTIINARDAQSVLNMNGVAVSDDPIDNLVWTIAPADNPILNDDLPIETHVARFDWTWATGKVGRHELKLAVRNLVRVV